MGPVGFFQQRAQQRRREAIVAYHGTLWRLAMAWGQDRNLADDLVQETLVRALEKADELRDEDRMRSWLCTILHHCWCNHWRRYRPTEDVEDAAIDARLATDDDSPREAESACIHRAIAALPEGQRQVLTLVELEGLSYKEVSSALDIPVGTVMSRLCRARRTLVERLEAPAAEDPQSRPVNLRAVK